MKPAELQPIPFTLRPDLILEEGMYQGEICWIVKDPIALKYFRLRKPEYLALTHLDGFHSLNDLKEILQKNLPQQLIKLSDLNQLISSFQQQGFLHTPGSGQGTVLLERDRKQKRQKLMGLATSLLSLKFPGIDPDRFLTRSFPLVGWLLSSWMTIIFACLMASAGILVLSNWDDFYRKLPDFQSFFSGPNLVLLGVLLILTKTVHELGHAYVCKRFGGQCHEIGVMLLVLMPTMYCNTSDSWILRNKWQRIAIGAAGMYVELIMAAICTWVWWFTNPGFLHYVCLNVMFLSSVSTILFNGNPLLRYDAYYMLSDFLEIPNLSQKSRAAMLELGRRYSLGMDRSQSQMVPDRNRFWFAAYSVASFAYRWFVVFSILWFLSKWFEPYGLEVVGHIMVLFSLSGMILVPLWQLYKFFEHPARRRQVKTKNMLITATVVLVLLSGFLFLPLPYSVSGTCLIQPKDAEKIFVKSAARIVEQPVQPGQNIQQGQEILRLDTIPLQLEIAQLQSQVDRLSQLVNERRRSTVVHDRGAGDLRRYQDELAKAETELTEKTNRLESMRLVSPRDGFIIPSHPAVRKIATSASDTNLELSTWWGDPFDPENLGATLPEETQVCWIGDPNQWVAEVYIEQSDIQQVQIGQEVSLLLEAYPGRTITGTIRSISTNPLVDVPPTMSSTAGGPLEVKSDPTTGQPVTIFNWYQVSVDLDSATPHLINGLDGQAKIHLPPTTMAQRTYRWVSVLLRFR